MAEASSDGRRPPGENPQRRLGRVWPAGENTPQRLVVDAVWTLAVMAWLIIRLVRQWGQSDRFLRYSNQLRDRVRHPEDGPPPEDEDSAQ